MLDHERTRYNTGAWGGPLTGRFCPVHDWPVFRCPPRLRLRCDWGPQYIADAWINEVKWLGITISPSYVGEPECNGVAERFMRTLKEQCLYLHRFETLAEAQRIIGEFIARYNAEWLIERLGHQTPSSARAAALAA